MRKLSKNRTDDDIVSSTNGSVNNDEPEQERPDAEDENEQAERDSLADKSSETDIIEPPKKRGSKNKTKKRKVKELSKNDKSEEEEEEYEVERVINSKRIKGRLHYLIRWKGYGADNDTWEPENTLSCPELINKFHEEMDESKEEKKSSKKGSKKRKSAKNEKAEKPKAKKPKQEWDEKDENAEYEVERILEVHLKKNGDREFLIHWKGWSTKFDSWEPEKNLNCPELINKFMGKVNAARSVDSRSLRVNPETTQRFTLQDPSSGRRLSKRRGQRQRIRYDGTD